jgi:hypothetical protein
VASLLANDPSLRSSFEVYGAKYDKAVACLTKDRSALLPFYDFPAEHWKHLRLTNPIESTFATVRHRTIRSKGCLGRAGAGPKCESRDPNENPAPASWSAEAGLLCSDVEGATPQSGSLVMVRASLSATVCPWVCSPHVLDRLNDALEQLNLASPPARLRP